MIPGFLVLRVSKFENGVSWSTAEVIASAVDQIHVWFQVSVNTES